MRWDMIAAAVLMFVGVAGAAEMPETAALRLQFRNDATVPDDVLDEARDEVSRIFARAGFQVIWTDAAPRFTVHLVPRVLGYARAASHVMGVASRTANGGRAQIFVRQVEALSRMHHVGLSTMLGHVIAHEVGHLLLPAHAHSDTGLMRAEWDATQMRDAARGALTFTDGQSLKIRAALLVFSRNRL